MVVETHYPGTTPVRISLLHAALEAKGLTVKRIDGEGENDQRQALAWDVVLTQEEGLDHSETIAKTVVEVNG